MYPSGAELGGEVMHNPCPGNNNGIGGASKDGVNPSSPVEVTVSPGRAGRGEERVKPLPPWGRQWGPRGAGEMTRGHPRRGPAPPWGRAMGHSGRRGVGE